MKLILMQRTVDYLVKNNPQALNSLPSNVEPVEIYIDKDKTIKYFIVK